MTNPIEDSNQTLRITDQEEVVSTDGESIYSNLNYSIKIEVAQRLESSPGKTWSQHSAWQFCGYVWFDGQKWKEEIWIYHTLQEVLEADTLEDLLEKANSKYGND